MENLLEFFYGDKAEMVNSLKLSIKKYESAPQTEKVVARISKYKSIILEAS